jgi:hypothetical protein
MLQLLLGMKAFQGQIERIGKVIRFLLFPNGHLGVVPYPLSEPAFDQLFQSGQQPDSERSGIDFIAHFDQEDQVLSAAKVRIQAENGSDGERIGGIFMLILLEKLTQMLFYLEAFSPLLLAQSQFLLQIWQFLRQTISPTSLPAQSPTASQLPVSQTPPSSPLPATQAPPTMTATPENEVVMKENGQVYLGDKFLLDPV